jgi:hypothetical protein
MKKTIAILSLVGITLVSCQKEISTENGGSSGGNGGGSTNGKLVKVVAVTDNVDTLTTLYTYDAQNRQETMIIDGRSGTINLHQYRKLDWDGAGRVSKVRQYIETMGFPVDTAVTIVHYPNATTMEYDYSIGTVGAFGFTTVDSTVYVYSAGKMTTTRSYTTIPLMGTPYVESGKNEFTFDSKERVSVLKQYFNMSTTPGVPGPLEHVGTQTYTYGSTVNYSWAPTNAAQAYWVGGYPSAVNDIMVKMQVDDIQDPSNSVTVNMSYVMGSGNKPVSATFTSSDGQVTKYTFFYQ